MSKLFTANSAQKSTALFQSYIFLNHVVKFGVFISPKTWTINDLMFSSKKEKINSKANGRKEIIVSIDETATHE